MKILILFLRICLVGFWQRTASVKSRDWAAYHELWGPPDHPIDAVATFYRTAQLSWHALRLVLLGPFVKVEQLKSSRTVILWTGVEPDPAIYVKGYCGEKEFTFINQLACPNYLHYAERIVLVTFLLCWCVVSLPVPLFTRSNSAFLRILEVARAFVLVRAVCHLGPERVFFYSSFQRYSNFLSLMIARISNTKVTRVPSPNSLHSHYSTCVCDEFIITSALQIPELKQLKQNWFVGKVSHWRLTGFADIPNIAYQTGLEGRRVVGLLSGGQWRRYERGDHYDARRLKYLDAEKQLHLALGAYIRDHPDVDVLVFPHPSEKSNSKVYARACALYRERIGDERVSLVLEGQRTHERFHDANVLVSLWSTSALDAIYCGHKVLFAQFGCPPISQGSTLDNIHAENIDKFRDKLDNALSCTVDEYFQVHDLLAFRHDYFDGGPLPISMETQA